MAILLLAAFSITRWLSSFPRRVSPPLETEATHDNDCSPCASAARARSVAIVAGLIFLASTIWLLVLSNRLPHDGFNRVYLGTDTRIFGPALGALVAVWWPLAPRNVSGRMKVTLRVTALVAGAWLVWFVTQVEVYEASLYRGGVLPLVAVLSAVLLVGFSTLSKSDPVTRWLGRRSYAVYLWSWPVQLLVADHWPYASREVVALITLTISLGVAEASWHLVEYPVQKGLGWAKHGPARNWTGLGLAAGSAVLVVAVFATSTTRFGVPSTSVNDKFGGQATASALSARSPNSFETALLGATSENSNGDDTSVLETRDGGLAPGVEAGEVVLLYGDSVPVTMYDYFPWSDPPDGVSSVIGRADIGCGLLAPLLYEYPYVGTYAAAQRDLCVNGDAYLASGLALQPDVMMLMPGAWEWSEVRSPAGVMVEAQSAEMAKLLIARLGVLAGRAERVGARTLIIPWACPGPRDDLAQRRQAPYLEWINGVFAQTVKTFPDFNIKVASLPPGVCTDNDATKRPTSDKNQAFSNEVHVRDADGGWWAWHQWLGPSVVVTSPS